MRKQHSRLRSLLWFVGIYVISVISVAAVELGSHWLLHIQ